MNTKNHTAMQESLVNCLTCGLLCASHTHNAKYIEQCPRCGASLHRRKEDSIAKTWAFLLAALVLYIPANTLPIMTSVELGQVRSDTILSGVFYLSETGQWPLALLVFFASIIVPILKLVILGLLLVSIHIRSKWRPAQRTKLYRFTEKIGRWSMVDIYVVTILVALVQFGSVADVEAEAGAIFFGAVVVLTIIAANTFDPRLIWDKANVHG